MTPRDWLFFLATTTVALATKHGDCFANTILDGRTSPEYELSGRDSAEFLLQNVHGAQGTSRIYQGSACVLHVLHNGKEPWDKGCRHYSTSEETVTLTIELSAGDLVIRTKTNEQFSRRREPGSAGFTVQPFGLNVNTVYNCQEGCWQVQGSLIPLHLQIGVNLTLFLKPVSQQERIIFEIRKQELEWNTLVFELAKSEDYEATNAKDWLSINISVVSPHGSMEFVAAPLWDAGGIKTSSVSSPDTVADFRLSRNIIWGIGCVPDLGNGSTSAAVGRSYVPLLLALAALAVLVIGIAVFLYRRCKAMKEGHTQPALPDRPQETAARSIQRRGTLDDHTYESVDDLLAREALQRQDFGKHASPSLPSHPPPVAEARKELRAVENPLMPLVQRPPGIKVDTVNEFYVSSDIRVRRYGDRSQEINGKKFDNADGNRNQRN
ncbi:uncharacterized protein LOC125025809 [Penaeus chinensis]|uniref:uncharacterized protein LOC125025809 n=1 Tax=Penaeus chinensis TaxID=139456 RepID=UPI001FB6A17D|nr:uncharacterized protein LOC125025809 [Penaeus chinensis]XP_047470010.1 uncharacterized protein LOC125025809 [Penaeus chinensis]